METCLRIDFGSGYNPRPGYKTCDFIPLPTLDYWFDANNNVIMGLSEDSVDEFYLRNTIHHIPDLQGLCRLLYKYLRSNGIITVIEPCPSAFPVNYLLDCIYYRWVNSKPEIWFSSEYRDYFRCFVVNGFSILESRAIDNVYIKSIFRKEG